MTYGYEYSYTGATPKKSIIYEYGRDGRDGRDGLCISQLVVVAMGCPRTQHLAPSPNECGQSRGEIIPSYGVHRASPSGREQRCICSSPQTLDREESRLKRIMQLVASTFGFEALSSKKRGGGLSGRTRWRDDGAKGSFEIE
jgi:hypothetical protein